MSRSGNLVEHPVPPEPDPIPPVPEPPPVPPEPEPPGPEWERPEEWAGPRRSEPRIRETGAVTIRALKGYSGAAGNRCST